MRILLADSSTQRRVLALWHVRQPVKARNRQLALGIIELSVGQTDSPLPQQNSQWRPQTFETEPQPEAADPRTHVTVGVAQSEPDA